MPYIEIIGDRGDYVYHMMTKKRHFLRNDDGEQLGVARTTDGKKRRMTYQQHEKLDNKCGWSADILTLPIDPADGMAIKINWFWYLYVKIIDRLYWRGQRKLQQLDDDNYDRSTF